MFKVLGDLIQIRVGDGTDQSPARTAEPISVKSALAQTKDILASTNRATKSVLQHISDKQWWKKTLTGLGPNKRIKPHFGVDDFDDMNAGFLKQSCHPFYESLYDVCYSNKVRSTLCFLLLSRYQIFLGRLLHCCSRE